jgi:hypothetical protein
MHMPWEKVPGKCTRAEDVEVSETEVRAAERRDRRGRGDSMDFSSQ